MSDRGPWFITEEQAAARDLRVVADFVATLRRVVVPGMPDNVVRNKLAARGYDVDKLRALAPGAEQAHG